MEYITGSQESCVQHLWLVYESKSGLKRLGVRDVVDPMTDEMHTIYISLISQEYDVDWQKMWLISPDEVDVYGESIIGKIK